MRVIAGFLLLCLGVVYGCPLHPANVSWNVPLGRLATEPSLQVVTHVYLMPQSPIYAKSWEMLKKLGDLGMRHVRYVPWFPMAQPGVGELDPPSGSLLCTPSINGQQWYNGWLDCGADGGTITTIEFASYGNAKGRCGAFTQGNCHASNSLSVLQSRCIGKQRCEFNMTHFGADPCVGTVKYTTAQVRCSNTSKQFTSWNMTWMDQQFLDTWNAISGNTSEPTPNFSTQPTWMYSDRSPTTERGNWNFPENPTATWYGYNRGNSPARNQTELGDYYGRLLAWYTKGGFHDVYGNWHGSPHHLNITMYEVFNEPDYEHAYTREFYTKDFDAVVQGIRRWADPEHKIKFVGMNLPNIDNQAVVVSWATYFLNPANHAPDVRDTNALAYIGFHAYPTNGGYSTDPNTFSRFFDYADQYVQTAIAASAVIDALSPFTKLVLNEVGTAQDEALSNRGVPSSSPEYWLASGSYFAYIWARMSALRTPSGESRVIVVGQSQFMDDNVREASVSMLDWTNGEGTGRYWVLHLLLQHMKQGDQMVNTTVTPTTVFAQGFLRPDNQRVILLINKAFSATSVSVLNSGTKESLICDAYIVDLNTGFGPPRHEFCNLASIQLPAFATAVIIAPASVTA